MESKLLFGGRSFRDLLSIHDTDTTSNLEKSLREFVDEYRELRPGEKFRAISYMGREITVNNPDEKGVLFKFQQQVDGVLRDLEDPRRSYDSEWAKLWDFWRFGSSIIAMQERIDRKKVTPDSGFR